MSDAPQSRPRITVKDIGSLAKEANQYENAGFAVVHQTSTYDRKTDRSEWFYALSTMFDIIRMGDGFKLHTINEELDRRDWYLVDARYDGKNYVLAGDLYIPRPGVVQVTGIEVGDSR